MLINKEKTNKQDVQTFETTNTTSWFVHIGIVRYLVRILDRPNFSELLDFPVTSQISYKQVSVFFYTEVLVVSWSIPLRKISQ
jgi:hypothetical protein